MAKSKRATVVDLFGAGGPPNPEAVLRAQWRTTDIANAKAFADLHHETLRFAHHSTGWHCWRAGRWERDLTTEVRRLAEATVAEWWAEVGTAGSDEERGILAAHFLQTGRVFRLTAMLDLATADQRIALPPDAFDRSPWLFTCANGTLDLRTAQLGPHRPEDLISKRSPVAYDATAGCPRFLDFLSLIFNGDQTLVDFLQRAGGYSLTGSVGAQCFFFCWGMGCNGKSTLMQILRTVCGDYATEASPTLLMQQVHEQHPTDIADLLGRRFVSAVETEQGRRLNEVRVKWLTGGDRLKARFMRQDFFEFEPTHKFWLNGNYKPVIRGTDPAIWRRIHLIPFTVDLRTRLHGELIENFEATLVDEFPGVLAWLVAGATAWYHDGLRPPAAVRDATRAYREEMDDVARWVEEACERNEHARTPFKTLYSAYIEELKHDALSKKAFAHELDRLGFHDERVNRLRFRRGLQLRGHDHEGDETL
jgi:putative DNA primase/helicase